MVEKRRDRINRYENSLAECACWNRTMAGRALRHSTTCEKLLEYLKTCGIDRCPPCQARIDIKRRTARREKRG